MPAILPRVQMLFQGDDLEIEDGFVGLTYFESVYGCAFYRLQTRSYEWEKWDRVVQDYAETPAMLRWGYNEDDTERWTEWRQVLVNAGNFRYEMESLYVDVTGTCAGWKLRENLPSDKTVFKDALISEIVSQIADRNKLKAKVRATKGRKTFYQCTVSDALFITNELLPQAVSVDGRTDYYFWIKRGETLVFEPPNLNKPHKYSFRLAPSPEVGNPSDLRALQIEYRRMHMVKDNAFSLMVRGFDPMQRKIIEWTANDDKVPYPALARRKPQAPENPSVIFPLPVPEPTEWNRQDVEDRAKQIWGTKMRGLFRTVLRVTPLLDLEPTDLIYLDVRDAKEQPHFLSGRYLCYATCVDIGPGKFAQYIYLERRTTE